MSYWFMNLMRPSLKNRILEEGVQLPIQQLPSALHGAAAKMKAVDLRSASLFLAWANANQVVLLPTTIETRWHEYKKKLVPASDEDAAAIWQAYNPDTPAETLLQIVLKNQVGFCAYVASNPSAPVDALKLLSIMENDGVRRLVARHNNVAAETLMWLAKDRDLSVREAVAKNYMANADALAELAADVEWFIRIAVAKHHATDPFTLARLANDREKSVRIAVARHDSAPPSALALLANDADPTVRQYVAENPSTPHEALSRLAHDDLKEIREAAAKNSGPPPPIVKTGPDLVQEFRSAKRALDAWLNESFVTGEEIDTNRVKGTIIGAEIDERGEPSLMVEDVSGRMITVDPLDLDADPPKKEPRAWRKRLQWQAPRTANRLEIPSGSIGPAPLGDS